MSPVPHIEQRFGIESTMPEPGGCAARHITITCGKCGAKAEASSPGSTPLPPEALNRKFKAQGWYVGRRTSQHRCPSCLFKPPKKPKPTETKTMDTTPKIVAASPVRIMQRSDRRRIMDRLDSVYPEPERGYIKGASDESVAKTLDVPRAWVMQVRDESYGPEFVVDVASFEDRIEDVKDEITKLTTETLSKIEALERKQDALIRDLQAVKKRVGS